MSQAKFIRALQNGPMTSREIANVTGMPQATVLSTGKKLRYQGKLTTKQVRDGQYWVALYTLDDSLVESKPKNDDDEPRCLLNPFDIRNAKGIFTPAEYKVMNAQARRIYSPRSNEITNNQYI
jgi:DNA-binding transcriptional ArsR family regulator